MAKVKVKVIANMFQKHLVSLIFYTKGHTVAGEPDAWTMNTSKEKCLALELQLPHRGSVSERNIASSRRVSIVDPVERNGKSRGDFLQTPLLPRIKPEVVPKSSRTAKVPPFVQLESLFAGDVFVSKYLTMFENYYQIHEEDNYLIEHYILTLMGLCYEYHL